MSSSAVPHSEVMHAPEEHPHPGTRTYVTIGAILAVITAAEVWVYTYEAIKALLVPLLLVLSAVKFALVVSYFMHLRFDDRLLRYMFVFGLVVAGSIITALLFLFHQYPLPPNAPVFHAQ